MHNRHHPELAHVMYEFDPSPYAAQQRIDLIQPMAYAQTRNALDGAVTHLSPYLTHGYVSVPEIAQMLYHRHRLGVQHKLIYELGWREYFQHLHAHLGEPGLFESRRAGVLPEAAYSQELPEDVRQACSRVPVIDHAVRMLYTTGYLHNHARLWLASYLMHVRKVHWRVGAEWLYSHLLDGDIASNALSWQWVAGTLTEKPYLFTARSIEPFAPEAWFSRGTSIDVSDSMMDIIARNQATVSQAVHSELSWAEPTVTAQPPAEITLSAPQPEVVAGREVWLAHPWQLADPPQDLPPDTLCVAALWHEPLQAHPWNERRWRFVTARMRAMTPHVWWSSEQELARVLAHASRVHTVAHLRLPLWDGVPWQARPMPRLFRAIDKPCQSFSKWWVEVNKGVRYLQQLVYPLQRPGEG